MSCNSACAYVYCCILYKTLNKMLCYVMLYDIHTEHLYGTRSSLTSDAMRSDCHNVDWFKIIMVAGQLCNGV